MLSELTARMWEWLSDSVEKEPWLERWPLWYGKDDVWIISDDYDESLPDAAQFKRQVYPGENFSFVLRG